MSTAVALLASSRECIAAIQKAADTGVYDIRGWGAKRKLPHFDDLLFLGASMSRYPLEGYRERCDTDVQLGTRNAKYPLHLDTPVTIAGMSFGALSASIFSNSASCFSRCAGSFGVWARILSYSTTAAARMTLPSSRPPCGPGGAR